MSTLRSDDAELLTALHGGSHENPPWRAFLQQLGRRCSADSAFVWTDPNSGEASWVASAEPPKFEAARLNQLRPLRVYAFEELDDALRQRSGARFGRLLRVRGAGGWSAGIGVAREASDFAAADSALLSALAPHVAIAVRNHVEIARARAHAALAEDVLQRAGISWRTVDGEMSAANWPVSAAETDHIVAKLGPAFRQGPCVIRLTEQREAVITPACGPNGGGLMLTRIHRRTRPEQMLCLAQLWSLTPSEARFAMTLAEGKTINEAAEALGLTLETARHYSKRLYAKTGARGLPDLVRRVITSVAMLA